MTEYCGGNESSQLLTSITEADDGDKNEDEAEDLSNGASGRESDGADEIIETYSESNSTAISHNVNREAGASRGSQFVKAEPLSAKQQVALWLTRTSTQEIYNELKMSNIKNWVYPGPGQGEQSKIRAKHPLCGPNRLHNQIHRNFSTKSLLEGSYCHLHEDNNPMRKCETVLALSEEPNRKKINFNKSKSKVSLSASRISFFKRCGSKCSSEIIPSSSMQPSIFPGIKPTNRLRSKSSILQCSRCASVISMSAAASRVSSRVNSRPSSQMSLMFDKKNKVPGEWEICCKICLLDCPQSSMVKLEDCGCTFCRECLKQYISFEVMEGAYDVSCPDPNCVTQGVLSQNQMESLTDKQLMEKHRTFRLNTEVSLDASRTWCPQAGCDTICHICTGNKSAGVPVTCPTCVKEFCSLCSATWHPGLTCAENGAALVKQGVDMGDVAMWMAGADAENIKRCPMCAVPIERDAGCAQMMCKRCKHVFCWYCLASLDDDFLLRHYDSGDCQGKLGHSRLSVILHRAQVIGIFAGFAVLLLVASPLLLVAAPCLICCKCRTCVKPNGGASRKLEMATAAAKTSIKQQQQP